MNKEINEINKKEQDRLVNEYHLNQFMKNQEIEVSSEDHFNYVREELHEFLMER